jgi:hypothetical protein
VLLGADDTVKLMGFEVARLGGADLEPRPRDPASRVGIQGAQTAEPPGGLTEQADIQALGRLLMQMLTGAVQPRSEGSSARPERQLGPEVPAAVRELVMQALAQSPERRAPDMGSVASALWVELYRVAERPIPTAPDSAAAGQPRARWQAPWRTVGIGALVALVVGVVALGAWVSWHALTAPPTVSSTIQAGPARRTPPARAPRASAPAPVGRSAEVAGRLPITHRPPRGEPIPRNEPAIESPPRVTPEGISLMPRATPPDPALPATTTPPPSMPGSAQDTPLVRVTPGPAPATVTPPTALATVAPRAACARNGRAPACARNGRAPRRLRPRRSRPRRLRPRRSRPRHLRPATVTPPPPAPATVTPPPPAPATVTPPPPAPAERVEATSGVPVRPAPESGASRQEPRREPDPSAIIDWLLKASPRQQR